MIRLNVESSLGCGHADDWARWLIYFGQCRECGRLYYDTYLL